jgi:uncharacterized protein (TIGR03435 family)
MGRVVDKTGIQGRYDFYLEYAGSWGPTGAFPRSLPDGDVDTAPPLFEALRQQLGLEVKETKQLYDFMIIDGVEKAPTEN